MGVSIHMLQLLLAYALVQSGPTDVKFEVDGVERTAVVYRSSDAAKASPVVFVWHGFTGNAKQAAFSYRVHSAWPEATVVYPQGLEVSLLGRKAPGWQIVPKLEGDRDVKFFDAMLSKAFAEYKGDPKRVYTCGMSNGAIFSYVLMATRGDKFAAAGPVGGYAPPAFDGAAATPILVVHGKKDALIPFALAERARDTALKNNAAGATQTEWMPGFVQYGPSKNGMEVVWRAHEGGHTWPEGTTEGIVKFFKGHTRG